MAKFYNKTIGFVPSDKDNQSVAKALELAIMTGALQRWQRILAAGRFQPVFRKSFPL
jgi:hypothetical protein